MFATKTCPNCMAASKMLQENGIEFEKLYVEDERELAQKLGLRNAPTLIVGEDRYVGVSGVREFIKKISKR